MISSSLDQSLFIGDAIHGGVATPRDKDRIQLLYSLDLSPQFGDSLASGEAHG
jgi:hypothetical protein